MSRAGGDLPVGELPGAQPSNMNDFVSVVGGHLLEPPGKAWIEALDARGGSGKVAFPGESSFG